MTPVQYTFLPWYRTGLASAIDANPAAGADRGEIAVTLQTKVGGVTEDSLPQKVRLIGPGDILGIDPRAVVRLEPRPNTNDLEPNYLAAIEFFDEDYPWRYSPRAPEGDQKTRLMPWLALLVLADDEFAWHDQGEGLPRAISVDAAHLPPAGQLWAWAHTHINAAAADPGNPAAMASLLKNNPAQGCSRIVAARRLQANTSYHAVLVPAFEAGRQAGLLPGPTQPGPLAWAGAGAVQLPIYFEWSFRTGEAGDFEALARRLTPIAPDPMVGRRPMNVSQPLDGMATPPIVNADAQPSPILDLEGALQLPAALPSPWESSSRRDFQQWLANFINLGESWVIDGSSQLSGAPALPNGTLLPIVLPPSYGRWHANVPTLDPSQSSTRWLEQINLDPRDRVAAAFGTLVLQKNQEDFMARAWAQYGELFRANRYRYRAQMMREVLSALAVKHFSPLAASRLVATTSLAHARVRAATGSPLTVRGLIAASTLTATTVQPGLRRILRQGGPLVKRFGRGTPQLPQLIADVASARTWLAPRWQQPAERFSLATPPPGTTSHGSDTWLGYDWDELRPLLVGLLLLVRKLVRRIPELKDVVLLIQALLEKGGHQHTVSAASLTVDAVREVHSAVKWIPPTYAQLKIKIRPEDKAPAAQDGNFSFAAWNYRQAVLNAHEWLQETIPAPAVRPILDLGGTAGNLHIQLAPYLSVRERVEKIVKLPDPLNVATYDPLDAIMAHPTFDDPTYDYLKKISQDYVVPNLSKVPNNSVSLLEANWRFIESFLVGLNHEMSRELLWRGYRTDQRGTCFSHFWDRRGIPDGGADIEPIHGWKLGGKLTPLGGNRPAGQIIKNNLVLVVRGDLLRRYPNTQVYAVRAVANPKQTRKDPFMHVNRCPGDENVAANVKQPVLFAQFDPDVYCFGFDLDKTEARGLPSPEPSALGWYFVLAERFGEPRFGLDEPATDPPIIPVPPDKQTDKADELTWAHLVSSLAAYRSLAALDLDQAKPVSPPAGFMTDPETNPTRRAKWNSDAADLAAILLQSPFRMYFHANDMLLP